MLGTLLPHAAITSQMTESYHGACSLLQHTASDDESRVNDPVYTLILQPDVLAHRVQDGKLNKAGISLQAL